MRCGGLLSVLRIKCHSERSEESVTQSGRTQILRFAQNDNDVL